MMVGTMVLTLLNCLILTKNAMTITHQGVITG
jgi:hypothetical protein